MVGSETIEFDLNLPPNPTGVNITARCHQHELGRVPELSFDGPTG
jgi:hypothetical protein